MPGEPAGDGAVHDLDAPLAQPALQFGDAGAGGVQGEQFAGVDVEARLAPAVLALVQGTRLRTQGGGLRRGIEVGSGRFGPLIVTNLL